VRTHGHAAEELVLTSLLRTDTASGVEDKKAVEEIYCSFVEVGDEGNLKVTFPLGKRGLEIGKRGDTRPFIFGRRTQDPALLELLRHFWGCLLEDLKNLIDLRVAREERFLGAHLGKDAADGPHVDSGRILTSAEKNFGCTIPESDDLS